MSAVVLLIGTLAGFVLIATTCQALERRARLQRGRGVAP
jgi:hypothetical protein